MIGFKFKHLEEELRMRNSINVLYIELKAEQYIHFICRTKR